MPRLSIIMPARNCQETVVPAIRSALRSLPQDSEIVVWNDGSTDRTSEAVSSVGDLRVRLLESNVSVGGGVARSELIEATDSEFLACMDADDLCLPWRWRVQARMIEHADVVFGSTVKFWSPFRWRPSALRHVSLGEMGIALLLKNPYSHPTMFARRASIVAVGGYRPMRYAQDYDLWLRVASAGGRMVSTGLPVLLYRQGPHQVSRSSDYFDRIRESKELREAYWDFLSARYPHLASVETPEARMDSLQRTARDEIAGLPASKRRHYQKHVANYGIGPFPTKEYWS